MSLFHTLSTTNEIPITSIVLGRREKSQRRISNYLNGYIPQKVNRMFLWFIFVIQVCCMQYFLHFFSAFVSCHCKRFSGIYLAKKTSINIRDPKLPEVGQLADHHIWQLLHKLHLLRGFKAPGWNKDTHILYYTNPPKHITYLCRAGRWWGT